MNAITFYIKNLFGCISDEPVGDYEIVHLLRPVNPKGRSRPVDDIPLLNRSPSISSISSISSDSSEESDDSYSIPDNSTEEEDEEEDEDIPEFSKEEEEKYPDNYKMNKTLKVMQSTGWAGRSNDLKSIKQYLEVANIPQVKVNSRSSVASLSDGLIKYLYETSSASQIMKTMKEIQALVVKQTPNINMRSKRFSQYRQILKQRFGEDSGVVRYHKKNGITFEEHADKQTVANNNRNERLENRVQATEAQVREILHKHASSDNVYDQVIALQLATGSRIIEALRMSKFEHLPREGWVNVIGLAKKKSDVVETVERPVFGLDVDEVIELANKIRKELRKKYPKYATMTNDELTKLLDPRINSRVKKLNIPGVETSHMMRKLYGQISYKLLSQDERRKIDPHRWVQLILAHKNINTSASYSNVKISKSAKRIVGSAEAVERKIEQIDEKDAEQDEEIAGRPVNGLPIIEGTNRRKTVAEVKALMIRLNKEGVKITDRLLKDTYHVGSKSISQLKILRRELNESLSV